MKSAENLGGGGEIGVDLCNLRLPVTPVHILGSIVISLAGRHLALAIAMS